MKTTIFDQRSAASSVTALSCESQARAMSRSFSFLACLTTAVLVLTFLTPKAAVGDTVLHNFVGPFGDGSIPEASLVADKFGNLYGTTVDGGANTLGTVFVMCAPLPPGAADIPPCVPGAAAWVEIVLYNFRGLAFADGANPTSTLIFGGNFAGRAFTLYGTTFNGGVGGNCVGGAGCGTVFELCAPAVVGGCGGAGWTENVLYSFIGGNFDGGNPFAGVIKDKADNLYGTTVNNGKAGIGTVFKLTPPAGFAPPWPEAIIHNFAGPDGANPYATLCCNSKAGIAFLYGTAVNGGTGAGTVFKLKNGGVFPLVWVYSFAGGIDGANPYGNVVLDAKGTVYGTAVNAGKFGVGTLYKLLQPPPPPPVAPLYAFCSLPGCADGSNPLAGPTVNGNNLYGTAFNGGLPCAAPGCGTSWDFTLPAGPFVLRQAFAGPAADGSHPRGGVVTDAAFPGDWYGTTTQGGGPGFGIVYSIP